MTKRRNDKAARARRQERAFERLPNLSGVDYERISARADELIATWEAQGVVCAGPGRWMCEAGFGHLCGAEPAARSKAIRDRTAAEEAFFAQGEEIPGPTAEVRR